MARLLGRLGFVWKRPKVVPAKADAEAQRAFLDGVLLPLMREAEADPATPLLFVDATHPAYDAHPASGWIRRGERAVLPSNHGRVNVTLNGALSWPAREMITREAVKITGPEMAAFFAQIEARYPAARRITLIADNATYNRAAVVREWLARPGCREKGTPAFNIAVKSLSESGCCRSPQGSSVTKPALWFNRSRTRIRRASAVG
jgi:hypothetical protein